MGGWQVPGYAEVAELGRGGTGRVVAAVDEVTGERVAIKYLADWLAFEPRFRVAFRAEAAILAGLQLPNVASLRRYVEWDGGAAIVMQLVEGVSLRAMLAAAGPTDPLAALSVLRGSLLGLAGAHAAGIVHRDYKPENVIVDPAGTSMLVDFGIATRDGTDGGPAGTPGYMAPEQWAGGPATPATDIYAAAVTYTECLTGTPPPPRPPLPAAIPQSAATAPSQAVQPADSISAVDGRLAALVARATSASPADRPASAAEFLAELESAADEQYGPGWDAAGRAALARTAAAVAGAAAGAAIGAAASAGQSAPAATAPAARATTRLSRRASRRAVRTAARTGKAGLSHGAIGGIGAAVAVAVIAGVTAAVLTHHHAATRHHHPPAGHHGATAIAYVAQGSDGLIVPVDLATNSAEKPIRGFGSDSDMAITPDGKTIYVPDGHSIVPIDAATGTRGAAIPLGAGPGTIVIPSAADTAYVDTGTELIPVDLQTRVAGTPIQLPPGIGAPVVAVTPDGQTAYVGDDLGDAILPVDLAAGTIGTSISVGNWPTGIAVAPDGKTVCVLGQPDGPGGTSTVTVINVATGTASPPIGLGQANGLLGIAISPDGSTAYVAGTGSAHNMLTPVNVITGATEQPIVVGDGAQAVAVSPDGKTALVVDNHGFAGKSTVVLVDLVTGRAGTPIDVGNGAATIVIAPASGSRSGPRT